MMVLISACLFLTLLFPGSSETKLECLTFGQREKTKFPINLCDKRIMNPVCYSKIINYPMALAAEELFCNGCTGHDCRTYLDWCHTISGPKICYSKIMDFPFKGENREQTLIHKVRWMLRKDCHPRNYTASLPDDEYIHLEVKCCHNRHYCNRKIKVSDKYQKNRALNGMQCPGCLRRGNESCTSETTVSCRDQENKCISFTGRIRSAGLYYPMFSFKGCATKNLCDRLAGTTEDESELMKTDELLKELECSSAEYPAQ